MLTLPPRTANEKDRNEKFNEAERTPQEDVCKTATDICHYLSQYSVQTIDRRMILSALITAFHNLECPLILHDITQRKVRHIRVTSSRIQSHTGTSLITTTKHIHHTDSNARVNT
jgi:hypothetical protein